MMKHKLPPLQRRGIGRMPKIPSIPHISSKRLQKNTEMEYIIEVMKKVDTDRKDFKKDSARSKGGMLKPGTTSLGMETPRSAREQYERMSSLFGVGTKELDEVLEEEDGGHDYGTYELVKKLQESVEKNQVSLIQNCQKFGKYFREQVQSSKNELEAALIEYFKTLAKERMPNVYIRSIKHVFREFEMDPGVKRSLELFEKRPKKRQNTIPTTEEGRDGERIRFDKDIMGAVSSVIRQFVSKAYIASIELIQDFISRVQELMGRLRNLNEGVTKLIDKVEKLQDDIQDKKTSCRDDLKKKSNILKIMEGEFEMKKLQRNILQYQFERRKESYERERKNFIRELEKMRAQFKDASGGSTRGLYGKINPETEISEKDTREIIERKLWKRVERERKNIEQERNKIEMEIEGRRRELDSIEQEKIEEYNRIRSEIIIEKSKIL